MAHWSSRATIWYSSIVRGKIGIIPGLSGIRGGYKAGWRPGDENDGNANVDRTWRARVVMNGLLVRGAWEFVHKREHPRRNRIDKLDKQAQKKSQRNRLRITALRLGKYFHLDFFHPLLPISLVSHPPARLWKSAGSFLHSIIYMGKPKKCLVQHDLYQLIQC
jgi:hypothetical protein